MSVSLILCYTRFTIRQNKRKGKAKFKKALVPLLTVHLKASSKHVEIVMHNICNGKTFIYEILPRARRKKEDKFFVGRLH